MFNEIDAAVDYENNTQFVNSDQMLRKYKKYAKRDFELIKHELCDAGTILEIGSGYGLLSVEIKKFRPQVKYWHLEKNLSLRELYLSRGDRILKKIDNSISPDIIIMAHCLEHIRDAPLFINTLSTTYPNSDILLFQTNPYGFIPKYLPWLWYGWSFDQHFYHFSARSLTELMGKSGRHLRTLKYYQLHQEPSLSSKGAVKLFLFLINFFIKQEKMDAYMIRFSKARG